MTARVTRAWIGSSWALTVLLLVVVVPPASMLVWLGAQLLQQDYWLLTQREAESRRAASQTAVHALDAALGGAERQLAAGVVAEGTVRLTFGPDDTEAQPGRRRVLAARTADHARGGSRAIRRR